MGNWPLGPNIVSGNGSTLFWPLEMGSSSGPEVFNNWIQNDVGLPIMEHELCLCDRLFLGHKFALVVHGDMGLV